MRRIVALLFSFACSLLFAPHASAQDDAARAREHFQRGTQLIQEGRWADATTELEAARDLYATAPVLYNLGIALRGVGRTRDAIEVFEQFIEELGSGGPPERIAEVRGYVRELQASLAHLTIEVDPPSASLSIDGEPVSDPSEVALDAGSHRVLIQEGRRRLEQSVSLEAGERRRLELALPASQARLFIDNPQSDAAVFVDGQQVGVGVVEREVDPGEHLVEVRAPSGETFRRSVTLEEGQELRLRAELGGEDIAASPWLWLGIGGAVVAGVVLGVVLAFTLSTTQEPYVGDLGVVTGVLGARW